MTFWNDERTNELRNSLETGLPIAKIAEQFGVSYHAVRNKTARIGLARPPRRRSPDVTPGFFSIAAHFWTDELENKLRELWAGAMSASEIAREIGHYSRSAIIGKANRLGLPPRATNTGRKSNSTNAPRRRRLSLVKKQRQELRATMQYGSLGPRTFELVNVGCDLPPTQADRPSLLWDLPNNGCRWPCEGDGEKTIFCGGDSFGDYSYCLRHCQMAYRPPQRRAA